MAIETTYPLARDGVFATIQGEGALLGLPTVFVRLAGCSVGCPQCDTDYRVHERLTAREIRSRVEAVRGSAEWVWVTGGEPADYDLWSLLEEMRLCGRVALATSGTKPLGGAGCLLDFLSVSPHGTPAGLKLVCGAQINLVPGLNGLRLADWDTFDASGFVHRYVTPLWIEMRDHSYSNDEECIEWVRNHYGWRLGVQAHELWGLP